MHSLPCLGLVCGHHSRKGQYVLHTSPQHQLVILQIDADERQDLQPGQDSLPAAKCRHSGLRAPC